MRKKVIAGAAILLGAVVLMGGFREYIWHSYEAPRTVGAYVKEQSQDLEAVSRAWFTEYIEELKGWKVPYDYRIESAEITGAEVMTETGVSYVQLDYLVRPVSANEQIVENLELISTDTPRVYQAQMVLRFIKTDGDTWRIAEKMRPAEYQWMTPQLQEERNEPQTKHYKMQTEEPMTYYIKDRVLYVTYDSGETLKEVPDGYEKVCMEANGTYSESLSRNSYVISGEFTAFVCYENDSTSLLYSTDQGETWQESRISKGGFKANTFLSRTEQGYYATFAVDRSLGSDYYVTCYSEDLVTWNQIQQPSDMVTNLACAFWAQNGYGYYSGGDGMFYLTTDNGAHYQEIQYPAPEEITAALGYNPFDAMESMYQEDGVTYMIVGQGDNGDYAKDGKLMKALYQSQDGENFTFVEEMNDEPEQAG